MKREWAPSTMSSEWKEKKYTNWKLGRPSTTLAKDKELDAIMKFSLQFVEHYSQLVRVAQGRCLFWGWVGWIKFTICGLKKLLSCPFKEKFYCIFISQLIWVHKMALKLRHFICTMLQQNWRHTDSSLKKVFSSMISLGLEL